MPRRSRVYDWDELNLLREEAERFITAAKQEKPKKEQVDKFCDYMDFVLCLVYAYGWKDAEEVIGPIPMVEGLDDKAVNLKLDDGKDFRDRVREQIDELSVDGLLKIIDTEMHRDYNTGVYEAGVESHAEVDKQWRTMQDEKVRDTHVYLESMIVGLNDRFYTFDGDSALYPGGFTKPENNIFCRCRITLIPR